MRRLPLNSQRRSPWPQAVPFILALTSGLGVIGLTPARAQLPPETGVWLDDTQQGAVEVYVCQDRADRLCGRIVWLREPLNAEGKPKFDRYNPNAALQGRPICGLSIMGNLAKSSDGGFDSGWIYDPKAGKSYSAAIVLTDPNTLTVTGYLGMKFMGKSFTWTRAPENLQRCSSGAPPPAAAPMKAPGQPQMPAPKSNAAVKPQEDMDGSGAAAAPPPPAQKQQAAPAANTKPAAPPKPKPPASASTGGAQPQTGAAKPAAKASSQASTQAAAAKPQAKTPAVSASPVLTQDPKPAKKQTAPANTEALPWQAR